MIVLLMDNLYLYPTTGSAPAHPTHLVVTRSVNLTLIVVPMNFVLLSGAVVELVRAPEGPRYALSSTIRYAGVMAKPMVTHALLPLLACPWPIKENVRDLIPLVRLTPSVERTNIANEITNVVERALAPPFHKLALVNMRLCVDVMVTPTATHALHNRVGSLWQQMENVRNPN